jgi:integral membrane protein
VATPRPRALSPEAIAANHRALIRYRVMAYVTGVLLIFLVFVGVPLQAAGVTPLVAKIVGTGHGFLFIVYLIAATDLTIRLRVPVGRMILVLLAGTVPFAAFYAERRLTEFCGRIERQGRAAAEAEAADGGTGAPAPAAGTS